MVKYISFFLLFLGTMTHSVFAVDTLDVQTRAVVAPDRMPVKIVVPQKWKYHGGDNSEWASLTFDDSDWELTNTRLRSKETLPKSGWSGIGWFRVWVSVDSAQVNRPVALWMDQKGASEVYLNGVLQYTFGVVGTSIADEKPYNQLNPRSILFDCVGEHLLTVRYSNFSSDAFLNKGVRAGFFIRLNDLNKAIDQVRDVSEMNFKFLFFLTGVPLFFALLHLLFFLFYPPAQENLYYSLFVICFSALSLAPMGRAGFFTNLQTVSYIPLIMSVALSMSVIAGLRFLYALFYTSLPKQFWVMLAMGLMLVIVFFGELGNISNRFWAISLIIYLLLAFGEMLRVVCLAMIQKKDGAWIIGVGFLGFIIAPIYLALIGQGYINPIVIGGVSLDGNVGVGFYGVICLVISMSVYLARSFAKTNLRLTQQLVQVRELSEKTLEQERRIQKEEAATREAQLRSELAEEQTQQKSIFLASMSHELRTPLNAIKGFTSLVLRRIGESIPVQQKENLEKVSQASDHLLAMINDLLDLSKIEAGRMEVNAESFDVNALVKSCCATVSPLLEERPNVALNYSVADGVGQVNTDPGRIRQMVINLLSNAIKFTEEGEVKVTVKGTYPQPLPEGRGVTSTAGESQKQMLEITVHDTGKGIPEDDLATIFDEYRQVKGSDTQHKGTGLGLSITKQFAELLGGTIEVASEVGKGSVFTVRIPVMYEEG
jgi:signal transduction histidine kinase